AVFDPALRYVRVNERLGALHGLPADALVGRTLRELAPELADTIEPQLRHVLETKQPIIDVELGGKWPLDRRDTAWLASYYPVSTPDGRTLGAGLVVVEITEQKRFEKLLSAQKEVLELVARGAAQGEVLEAL